MATTATDLAADLGVTEGDIAVVLGLLDADSALLPDDVAAFVQQLLDPHGERTAPPGLYWPGADPRPPRAFGLGGPDPTA